ncbi:MAG: prepilin-type N-terminal cleavage/methylation domain-containing protein [Fimbriimonas sp.]|nr:prepilin-type N-terminal cleavage/methylation domain-containing protein [Fimbriimonas sp.]
MSTVPKPKTRGFTLIEMMVVIVVVALLAIVVAPYLVSMRDGQEKRAFYTSVADLAGQGREMAITNDATMYLQVDSSSNAVVLKQEVNTTTYQNTTDNTATGSDTIVVNGHTQSTRTNTNVGTASGDRSQDKIVKTCPLSSGIRFGNFELAGSSSDAGSFSLHFYPDGTSDGGGMELVEGRGTKSIVISARGAVKMQDGTLPDSSTQQWQAGDYVHRA